MVYCSEEDEDFAVHNMNMMKKNINIGGLTGVFD